MQIYSQLLRCRIEDGDMAALATGNSPAALDAFDLRILGALQADSSLSTNDLSDAVGLSQSPCWRRLQRLRQEGYIKREVALLDRERLGLNVQVFAMVKLSAHGRANVTQFTHAVGAYPEVLECHITLGGMDCMLRVVTSSMEAYRAFFFDKLSTLPGVQEVNSVVSLDETKSTTALPLG
jgi:Lrp/AsnC family transcriptional regulator